jgi:hypothetical protein
VTSNEQAENLGADGWAANARELIAILDEMPARTPVDNSDEYFGTAQDATG